MNPRLLFSYALLCLGALAAPGLAEPLNAQHHLSSSTLGSGLVLSPPTSPTQADWVVSVVSDILPQSPTELVQSADGGTWQSGVPGNPGEKRFIPQKTEVVQVPADRSVALQPEGVQFKAFNQLLLSPLTSRAVAQNIEVPAPITSTSATSLSPLERPPIRLFNLETANQLETGTLSIGLNVRGFGTDRFGSGTGLQVYGFNLDGGVSDQLQLGLAFSLFSSDVLGRQINGRTVYLDYTTIAPNFKYQLAKDNNWSLGVGGSLEISRITASPGLFSTGSSTTVAGTLQLPVSYALSPQAQLHFTPGVAFFPEQVGGAPFYGTFVNLGTGLSWQLSQQLGLFADLNYPLGPGGNAIRGSNGSVFKQLVWSAGLRYLINPAVGLDLYATNAFGLTPATRLLSFIPDGDQTAIAANLTFTPDLGQNYAADYRAEPRVRLTNQDRQLLLDGITLSTPDTLLPRMLRLQAGIGNGSGINIATGLTNDVQLELMFNQFNQGADLTSRDYGTSLQQGGGFKFRFLDQIQGDPFSLGLRAAIANDPISRVGNYTIELASQYRPIPQLALLLNPKAGFVSSRSVVGVGLGINYELLSGVQLMGEYTPIVDAGTNNAPGVWSVGARYFDPQTNLGIDLYGSNAIGQSMLGGLVAKANGETSVGVKLHWLFGGEQP